MKHLSSEAPQAGGGTPQPESTPTAYSRPWSIKGIDEATVQMCKLAARGRGMKINRWVEEAVRVAAENQFAAEPAEVRGRALPQSIDVCERLARLEGMVESINQTQAAMVAALSTGMRARQG